MQTNMWNPWALFDELLDRRGPSMGPAFDIEDDEDATLLTADVPGMTEQDVEVTVQGAMLIVRGERKPRDGKYVQRSRWHGAFERQFQLGDRYDLDQIQAAVHDGVLTIRLPKAARAKPRRIKLGKGMIDRVKGLLSGDGQAA